MTPREQMLALLAHEKDLFHFFLFTLADLFPFLQHNPFLLSKHAFLL